MYSHQNNVAAPNKHAGPVMLPSSKKGDGVESVMSQGISTVPAFMRHKVLRENRVCNENTAGILVRKHHVVPNAKPPALTSLVVYKLSSHESQGCPCGRKHARAVELDEIFLENAVYEIGCPPFQQECST